MDVLILVLLLMLPVTLILVAARVGFLNSPEPVIAQEAVRWFDVVVGIFLGLLVLQLVQGVELHPWLSLRPLTLVMLGMVLLIGWVVVRYSKRYMTGLPRQAYFYRWLLLTIASVLLTVMANHLMLFLLGWVVISLSLHRLLVLYPHRQRTLLASHKKFLVARIGELSLAVGFLLIYNEFNTANIDELLRLFAERSVPMTVQLEIAACCLALTALLKCAQLPLHGWLIQVVDAPTPVSALLHAGVINLGGFLLILFAPLLQVATVATATLLFIAGLSFVLSALIMQTRITVKVRLAWSTSAQMGFMLVECALGLYELALLHLITHSLYKAYAFLSAGTTVASHQDLLLSQFAQAQSTRTHWTRMLLAISTAMVLIGLMTTQVSSPVSIWLLLGFAYSLYLFYHSHSVSRFVQASLTATAFLIMVTFWKSQAYSWFGLPAPEAVSWLAQTWLLLLVVLLMTISLWLRKPAVTVLSRRWQNALFAGLYLDEWFTRVTMRVWPIELPLPASQITAAKPAVVQNNV
jgi:NAD(P)H-quinone oxidoreductase subunit 5